MPLQNNGSGFNTSDGKQDAPAQKAVESSLDDDTSLSDMMPKKETVLDTAMSDTALSDLTISDGTEVKKAESAPISVPFDGVLKYGDDDKAIEKIQQRLMDLYYMDNDEVTDHFGPITRDAILRFQERNDIEVTGHINADTYKALMSEDAVIFALMLGDEGDDVYSVQDRLYEMGYLSTKPTGYFGENTEKAVKNFQKNNELSADGKVGVETKDLMFNGDAVPNIWGTGDSSETLIPYQERLIKLGYLSGEADGEYGSNTKSAVKRFQDRNGLTTDGYLGPKTIEILMSDEAVENAYAIGDDCYDVEKIQKRLYNYGYIRKSGITGYYGSATEYAVKAFQKRNDLTADGRVGRKTLKALNSDDAKKPSSSYEFYGEGGSGSGSSSGSGSGSGNSDVDTSGASVEKLVNAAKSRLGCKYVLGAKGPNQFDCSGLVYWCLNKAGIKQSYLTSYGWRSVTKYKRINDLDDLKAGDIIVFYGHVGIIVSDSDMIDASSSRGEVVRRSFHGSWSRRNFICGYRIFD